MSDDDFVSADSLAFVVAKLKEAGVENPKQTDTVTAMGAAKVKAALELMDQEFKEYGETPSRTVAKGKTVKEMAQWFDSFRESMG